MEPFRFTVSPSGHPVLRNLLRDTEFAVRHTQELEPGSASSALNKMRSIGEYIASQYVIYYHKKPVSRGYNKNLQKLRKIPKFNKSIFHILRELQKYGNMASHGAISDKKYAAITIVLARELNTKVLPQFVRTIPDKLVYHKKPSPPKPEPSETPKEKPEQVKTTESETKYSNSITMEKLLRITYLANHPEEADREFRNEYGYSLEKGNKVSGYSHDIQMHLLTGWGLLFASLCLFLIYVPSGFFSFSVAEVLRYTCTLLPAVVVLFLSLCGIYLYARYRNTRVAIGGNDSVPEYLLGLLQAALYLLLFLILPHFYP